MWGVKNIDKVKENSKSVTIKTFYKSSASNGEKS